MGGEVKISVEEYERLREIERNSKYPHVIEISSRSDIIFGKEYVTYFSTDEFNKTLKEHCEKLEKNNDELFVKNCTYSRENDSLKRKINRLERKSILGFIFMKLAKWTVGNKSQKVQD